MSFPRDWQYSSHTSLTRQYSTDTSLTRCVFCPSPGLVRYGELGQHVSKNHRRACFLCRICSDGLSGLLEARDHVANTHGISDPILNSKFIRIPVNRHRIGWICKGGPSCSHITEVFETFILKHVELVHGIVIRKQSERLLGRKCRICSASLPDEEVHKHIHEHDQNDFASDSEDEGEIVIDFDTTKRSDRKKFRSLNNIGTESHGIKSEGNGDKPRKAKILPPAIKSIKRPPSESKSCPEFLNKREKEPDLDTGVKLEVLAHIAIPDNGEKIWNHKNVWLLKQRYSSPSPSPPPTLKIQRKKHDERNCFFDFELKENHDDGHVHGDKIENPVNDRIVPLGRFPISHLTYGKEVDSILASPTLCHAGEASSSRSNSVLGQSSIAQSRIWSTSRSRSKSRPVRSWSSNSRSSDRSPKRMRSDSTDSKAKDSKSKSPTFLRNKTCKSRSRSRPTSYKSRSTPRNRSNSRRNKSRSHSKAGVRYKRSRSKSLPVKYKSPKKDRLSNDESQMSGKRSQSRYRRSKSRSFRRSRSRSFRRSRSRSFRRSRSNSNRLRSRSDFSDRSRSRHGRSRSRSLRKSTSRTRSKSRTSRPKGKYRSSSLSDFNSSGDCKKVKGKKSSSAKQKLLKSSKKSRSRSVSIVTLHSSPETSRERGSKKKKKKKKKKRKDSDMEKLDAGVKEMPRKRLKPPKLHCVKCNIFALSAKLMEKHIAKYHGGDERLLEQNTHTSDEKGVIILEEVKPSESSPEILESDWTGLTCPVLSCRKRRTATTHISLREHLLSHHDDDGSLVGCKICSRMKYGRKYFSVDLTDLSSHIETDHNTEVDLDFELKYYAEVTGPGLGVATCSLCSLGRPGSTGFCVSNCLERIEKEMESHNRTEHAANSLTFSLGCQLCSLVFVYQPGGNQEWQDHIQVCYKRFLVNPAQPNKDNSSNRSKASYGSGGVRWRSEGTGARCLYCCSTKIPKLHLQAHVKNCHEHLSFRCKQCVGDKKTTSTTCYDYEDEVRSHIKLYHPQIVDIRKIIQYPATSEDPSGFAKLECKRCNWTVYGWGEIAQHESLSHKTSMSSNLENYYYYCRICSNQVKFVTRDDFQKHCKFRHKTLILN